MQGIKIFYLISRLDIGGAEKQLLNLASNLDKEKYEICVGYFEGKGELRKEFQRNGIKTKKFRFKGLWDISIWYDLYQDMKANKYDIVHTHGFKADLWGAITARLSGVPIVISTVHNQEQYLKNPIIKLLEKWIISSLDDIVIAISDGVKRFLINTSGIPEKKIERIYYGINTSDINIDKDKDIRQEFGIDKETLLVGCIGRLVKQKGHRYLIQAVKKVIEKNPKTKFFIIGRGKLEKNLKNMVKSSNLDSSVIFTGFREDVYSLIDKLDLIVMPSLWEGLGVALLEALALGKPIVAAAVGGIPEVIRDKETGVLVAAKDAEALAKAIIKLLQEPALAKELGKKGSAMISEQFTINRMVKEVDRIYSRAINRKLIKKIKVLQIIESTGKSGPRYLLGDLAHGLNKDIFKVEIICSSLRDKDFYRDILKMRESGIKVILLQMKRNISLLSDLIVFLKLCFYIRRGRYDIVHTYSAKAGFLGRLSARLMGVKAIIYTPHCFCFADPAMNRVEKRFYFYLEKFAALFCDKIIAVAESQRQDALKKGLVETKKIITIVNGVDTCKFSRNGLDLLKKKQGLGLNNGSVILGSVGVLNRTKSYHYLIEAVSRVTKEGFDVTLLIAGEGYLRKDLKILSNKLGLDSRVKLLGFREDIPELLPIMDIFISSSVWEGMSLALLEAMACGLPVICTDVHGAVDLIEGNKNGILVQKKDIEGLAKAMKYLICNPDQAKRMGQQAQRLVCANYTSEGQIRKIEGLYMGLNDKPHSRHKNENMRNLRDIPS